MNRQQFKRHTGVYPETFAEMEAVLRGREERKKKWTPSSPGCDGATGADLGVLAGGAHLRAPGGEWGSERFRLPGKKALKDFTLPFACDAVIVETTYAGDTHRSLADTVAEFRDVVRRSLSLGEAVIIPSFALERTQNDLSFLKRLMDADELPSVPVYLDSPMAAQLTRLYRDYAAEFGPDVARALSEGAGPLLPPWPAGVEFARRVTRPERPARADGDRDGLRDDERGPGAPPPASPSGSPGDERGDGQLPGPGDPGLVHGELPVMERFAQELAGRGRRVEIVRRGEPLVLADRREVRP